MITPPKPELENATAHFLVKAVGFHNTRHRKIIRINIARLTGGLVVSTDNLSEFWMGLWTLNGDAGDFSPFSTSGKD